MFHGVDVALRVGCGDVDEAGGSLIGLDGAVDAILIGAGCEMVFGSEGSGCDGLEMMGALDGGKRGGESG